MSRKTHDVVIIGSGPAGTTAAIYASRALLDTVMIMGSNDVVGEMNKDDLKELKSNIGGQLMITSSVENYPGFLDISGPELSMNMMKQVEKHGVPMINDHVYQIQTDSEGMFLVSGYKNSFNARAVILATGATANRLYLPGTKDGEFWNRGVSACAVCDGALPMFRNGVLLVIGGGDSAMEEALFLTRFAKSVVIVHRRKEFRASKIMLGRARTHPKITFMTDSILKSVHGTDRVEFAIIENIVSSDETKMPVNGVFFGIGHTPNTDCVKTLIDLDSSGHVKIDYTRSVVHTSMPGIFAAGDVADKRYRQAITAAAYGCIAALEVIKLFDETGVN